MWKTPNRGRKTSGVSIELPYSEKDYFYEY